MAVDAVAALELWDRAQGHSPIERSLQLATSADPVVDVETAARLPIGERNRLLLGLRSGWSIEPLVVTADCPECDTANEAEVSLAELLDIEFEEAPAPLELGSRIVEWRPINTADLLQAAGQSNIRAAEEVLLQSCLIAVTNDGEPEVGYEPDSRDRSALADAIVSVDPLAEVLVGLDCVECGAPFSLDIDVPEIVWTELSNLARSLLADVDALARTYGWTESDCLALSPARRSWYVEMATA